MTFAQNAILKKIEEKTERKDGFQDYNEHSDYDAYSDCHGDYYDN